MVIMHVLHSLVRMLTTLWLVSDRINKSTGRRVIECYLNLFLHSRTNSGLSTPHLFHRMDYDELSSKILDTHVLGEYVGAAWKLERIMRWVPAHVR